MKHFNHPQETLQTTYKQQQTYKQISEQSYLLFSVEHSNIMDTITEHDVKQLDDTKDLEEIDVKLESPTPVEPPSTIDVPLPTEPLIITHKPPHWDIQDRFFNPKRTKKPCLYKFIKLLAPTNELRKWKTKDAVSAYCIRCQMYINYTPGSSTQIIRHMKAHHPEEMEYEQQPTPVKPNVVKKNRELFKFTIYLPESHLEGVKMAMFNAGAGVVGNHKNCCWEVLGRGQFTPMEDTTSYIGGKELLKGLSEYRVEILCQGRYVENAVKALKQAHPYTQPAYHVVKCLNF